MENFHKPVKNLPICKFYYKGSHSHYVKRTVLKIPSINPNLIVGYELKEGSINRKLKNSPIKSYNKSRIAKWSQIGAANHKIPGPKKTTLERISLIDYIRSDT